MIFFLIFLLLFLTAIYFTFANLPRLRFILTPEYVPTFPKLSYLALILVIIAYNLFLYGTFTSTFPYIGFAAFNLLCLIGFFVLFPPAKRTPLTLSLFIVSAIFATLPVFRANGFVQVFDLLLTLAANSLLILIYTFDRLHWQLLWLAKNLIRFPFKSVGHTVQIFSQPKSASARIPIIGILKTVILSLIVFAVFASLLSAADPIFKQVIDQFFDQAVERLIWSCLLAFLTAVIISQRLSDHPRNSFRLTLFNLYDLTIPTLIAIALLTTFLIIQARYLFASPAVFATLNLTYSEYVRQGFVELLVAAFLGGLISYLITLKHRLGPTPSRLLPAINLTLILELLLLLASALKRNLMYVEVYGLTRVRVIGGFFLFWLAVLLIGLLILALYHRFQEKHLFTVIWVTTLIVGIGLNIFNLDRRIAIAAPGHHQYTDYFYLTHLSPDTYFQQQSFLPVIETEVTKLTSQETLTDIDRSQLAGLKLALITLREKRLRLYQKYADPDWQLAHYRELYPYPDAPVDQSALPTPEEIKYQQEEIARRHAGWRQYNLPEYRAYQDLVAKEPFYLDTITNLLTTITTYQETRQVNLYDEEARLLYDFKYPFIHIYLTYRPQYLDTYRDNHKTSLPSSLYFLLNQNQPTVNNLPTESQSSFNLNVMVHKNTSETANNSYTGLEIWDYSNPNQPLTVYADKTENSTRNLLNLLGSSTMPFKITLAPLSTTYFNNTLGASVPLHGYQLTSWQEIKLFDPASDPKPPR